MSPIEECKKMGRRFRIVVDDEQAEHIIWGKTGFPCFWSDRKKTPLQNFQKHLYDFFEFAKRIGIREALSDKEEMRYYEHGPISRGSKTE
jgi:hypothetical protein